MLECWTKKMSPCLNEIKGFYLFKNILSRLTIREHYFAKYISAIRMNVKE